MKTFKKKSIGLLALSITLAFLNNCASETIGETHAQNDAVEQDKPVQLSVDAMVVADPPPFAPLPVPIAPIVPVAPILPPPIPLPPPILTVPEPFLWNTRLVPPEMASLAAAKGELPSRHGNKTFLYSFVNDAPKDRHHHRHRDRHRDDE
jgi:hypothetical protein